MATKAQLLPDLRVPLIDRYRRITAPWWSFIRPLLETTKQNTSDIATVTTTAASNAAAITTETIARQTADGAIAAQITTLTATVNTNNTTLSAAVATETSARIAGDTATAAQITTLNASVASNAAAITNEQTARANGDSANASSISTLSTTVAGQTTSIAQLISSDNGQNAQYSVRINANGRITGIQLIGNTATGTDFIILADKFLVLHPTNNAATPVQAFVVGLINGVATVGINGNVIVDGSIIARHINVSTLSAITANIGEVTAGKIRSATGKSYWDLTNDTFVLGAP